MTLLHRLRSVLDWILRRSRAEQGLDDELRGYIEMSAADKMRDGHTAAEARRLATLELGGLEPAKERVRSGRHGAWLDDVARDVRYACRMFGRTPGFTAVIVVTLALGIGANTAIYSLIDALMLRSLPVSRPQELLQIHLKSSPSDAGGETFSYPIARGLAEQTDVFSGVAAFTTFDFDAEISGVVTRVPGAMVSGGFYDTLGLRPAAGRLLVPADDVVGAPLVAVLSDGFWERQFGRRPDVVGSTLRIGGVPVTIAGVSPRGFAGASVGAAAEITMPIAAIAEVSPTAAPLLGAGNFWLRVLARPRPGVSASAATARLNVVWPQIADGLIAKHWPASQRQLLARSRFYLGPGGTGWTFMRGIYRQPLLVLMAVAGLVLLITCANVASLLLARASARRPEIAVRLAIGAGRGRIVRQLLIESTMLSAIGAVFGLALAWMSSRFLVSVISTGPLQPVFDLAPNWNVLGFTSAAAILTGMLFGIAPAVHGSATGPALALQSGTRTSGAPSRWLPVLVCGQVALSLVLLSGAGLFVRTLQNLNNLDPGFSAEGVVLADLGTRRTALPASLIDDIRALPGVTSASLSTHTPLNGSLWSEPAVPAGQAVPERDTAIFVGAGTGFFETMQIQVMAGRGFTELDRIESPGVAIVNEAYAAKYFGKQSPVGQYLAASVRGVRRDLEIVGLARNTRAVALRAAPPRTVYVAYAQLQGDLPTSLSVRASGSSGELAVAVRQTLQSHLPTQPIEVHPLAAQVSATIVQDRMLAVLASAFGALALTLACVGLYGLLAYGVAQRTKEIGIRLALGAQPARVVGSVLTRGGRLVLIGIAIGLPAAWAGSRWIASMLFDTTPTDPIVAVSAIVLLIAAAQVAAYLPARRAARVDPLLALREG